MKTLKIYLVAVLILTALLVTAQKKIDLKVFESLPQSLELNDELQKFVVTTTHFNSDIFGNFFNKMRVTGEYTRGLGDGKVKWNNVSVATAMQRESDFHTGEPLNYMENFSYLPSDNMLKEDAFTGFGENSAFAKNLVWDMLAIESFAWEYFDELKLNETFKAVNFNGKLDLAGQGSFENKDVRLTWSGVSKQNGELCAVIEYQTMNNPLEISYEGMDMKGRSHYWGTIWVSLQDKQIEHAVLFEDVVMEMNLPGQSNKQIMNATREISFVKVI